MDNRSISRRDFLTLSAAGLAATQLGALPALAAAAHVRIPSVTPAAVAIPLSQMPGTRGWCSARLRRPNSNRHPVDTTSVIRRAHANAGASPMSMTIAAAQELIALALSVAVRCDPCIGFHAKALVKLGATRQEIDETLGRLAELRWWKR